LIQLPDKIQELIIWSYHIEYLFTTLGALVSDHISLILLVVYPDWSHESMTRREAITWERVVHMERIETVWTVVAC
jgi:GTPase